MNWLELAENAFVHRAEAGEVLISEGEKLDHLVVVLNGSVCVARTHTGEKTTRVIASPELYGESWLLNQPASVSLTVASPSCSVIRLHLDSEMAKLFTEDPSFKEDSASGIPIPLSPRFLPNSPMVRTLSVRQLISLSPKDRLMSDSRFGSPNESSQLSACRIASDPDSPDFQEALRRKNLFFQVASKLLARLQDSITAYEAFHSEETT